MPRTPREPRSPHDDASRAHRSGAAPSRPGDEVYIFDRAALRELDRLAYAEFGMPTLLLMENAARNAADAALDLVDHVDLPHATILCGPGNNGGDGLAIARHLHNHGVSVEIVLATPRERVRGDARTNLDIALRMGLNLREAQAGVRAIRDPGTNFIIDALLGTGADRPVEGLVAELIEEINAARPAKPRRGMPAAAGLFPKVLSIDLPSGLDADTGRPLGKAVVADTTVTFAGLKPGFTTLDAQGYIGDLIVADIGAPRELLARLGKLVDPMTHG